MASSSTWPASARQRVTASAAVARRRPIADKVGWVVYGLLLWRQPADPFVAWHGDVAWPAEHFLTHSQGGLLLPIFAHVMVGDRVQPLPCLRVVQRVVDGVIANVGSHRRIES